MCWGFHSGKSTGFITNPSSLAPRCEYFYERDLVIPSYLWPSSICKLTEKQGNMNIPYLIPVLRVSLGSHPVRRVCQLVINLREGPGLSTPNIIHLVLINGNRRFHPSLKTSADFMWRKIRSQGVPHLPFPRQLGICTNSVLYLLVALEKLFKNVHMMCQSVSWTAFIFP